MTDYNNYFENWKRCAIGGLTDLFNYEISINEIHENPMRRISCFVLATDDVKRINTYKKEIKDVTIFMGVIGDETTIDGPRFCPFLVINHKSKKPLSIAFTFDPNSNTRSERYGDSNIPLILKNILTDNWMELENSQVQNAFSKSHNRSNERLLWYYFEREKENDQLILALNAHKSKMNQFCFYLGIDFNKVNRRDEFSFSPVLEIQLSEQLSDKEIVALHKQGIRSMSRFDNSGDDIFIEYIRPCPTTCM